MLRLSDFDAVTFDVYGTLIDWEPSIVAFLQAWAQAAPQVVDLPTRPGVTVRMLVLQPAAPTSVAVLISGGAGQLGIYGNGSLRNEGNFLVRSRQAFVERGHAVVLLDVPSDRESLRGIFRESAEHAADLGAAVAWARQRFGKPQFFVKCLNFGLGRRSKARHGVGEFRLIALDALLRVLPGKMHRERFLLADLAREILIAPRLPRLTLQRLSLRL